MSVRAKFKVETKDPGEFGNVTMRPVYSTDPNHENKSFWDATPSGEIRMWINNKAAFAQFEPGDEIYVDFSKAPKDADVPKCESCGQYHVKVKAHEDEQGKYFVCSSTQSKVYLSERTP